MSRDEVDQTLISLGFDNLHPSLYPSEPIPETRVSSAADTLGLPIEEVRGRYEDMAREYGLRLT